ncbi:allophanate hydrolase, partial [Halobacteriales archaeon QH_10_67_22]
MYELQARKREVAAVFDGVDVLVTPTTGTIYTIDEVQSEPVELNSNLGYYTNFTNLLDLSAVAVPVDTFEAGPGFGVTVFGDAFEDGLVAAVARGQVAFALGTDTAGSGRVPAAFNRLVGLKPTRGAVSTRGVVPACRTLDCVSVFANTVEDARAVGEVAVGYDAADPYSRPAADDLDLSPPERPTVTVGVPDEGNLAFFGDDEAAGLFDAFREDLADGPWTVETVDFAPFVETASLLYGGPWVAERYAAVGEFLATDPDDADPVVERIIEGGADYSAVDTFEAMYELQARKREVAAVFDGVDVLVTPTTGTIYT